MAEGREKTSSNSTQRSRGGRKRDENRSSVLVRRADGVPSSSTTTTATLHIGRNKRRWEHSPPYGQPLNSMQTKTRWEASGRMQNGISFSTSLIRSCITRWQTSTNRDSFRPPPPLIG